MDEIQKAILALKKKNRISIELRKVINNLKKYQNIKSVNNRTLSDSNFVDDFFDSRFLSDVFM